MFVKKVLWIGYYILRNMFSIVKVYAAEITVKVFLYLYMYVCVRMLILCLTLYLYVCVYYIVIVKERS